jgi:hypothetical protein
MKYLKSVSVIYSDHSAAQIFTIKHQSDEAVNIYYLFIYLFICELQVVDLLLSSEGWEEKEGRAQAAEQALVAAAGHGHLQVSWYNTGYLSVTVIFRLSKYNAVFIASGHLQGQQVQYKPASGHGGLQVTV